MTREEAIRYIDAYVDNELDVKDALEIQAWIEKDEVCGAEYERIIALKEMLRGKLGEEGPGASDLLKHRVREAIRREGLRQTDWSAPRWPPLPLSRSWSSAGLDISARQSFPRHWSRIQ